MLELRDVVCCYGPVAALKGISLTVGQGQLVALIGANGAGKTTTLRPISEAAHPTAGTIAFEGHDITRASPRAVLSLGIAHCPEGRHVFPQMTVLENLEMGCYLRTDRREIAADMTRIFEQFPRLAERRQQAAGTLSGGEQQMLAIGRALISRPKLIMFDEPRSDSPPPSSSAHSTSSPAFAHLGRRFSWWSRMPPLRSIYRHAYLLESGAMALEGAGRELIEQSACARGVSGGVKAGWSGPIQMPA